MPIAEGHRLCPRCDTTADGLTPALDVCEPPTRASGKYRSSRAEPDPDVCPPGTTLGVYRIVDLIGEGGIGFVYLAEHVKLGRSVAIKMLRSKYGAVPHVVDRFFAEARAANQIAHENIVQVTDFIEHEEHGSYLVMELLEGADLDELIEREGALPVRRVLHIMTQVASALAAAHRAGIVHRDLKPENIFLTRRGETPDFVKILDFGVAKLTGDAGAADGFDTAAGAVVGTPAYMSPEQARGRTVDARTDVYAFGVILYELLTGDLPFSARTLGDFIIKHSTEDALPPSQRPGAQAIPRALDELVMQCLEKQPEDRPASMLVVEHELRAIATDESPSLELPVVRVPPARRSSPLPLILGGIALLGLLGGLAIWALSSGEAGHPSAAADAPTQAPTRAPTEAAIEPLPEPEPAPEPTTISLSFASEPPGAEVWPAGADAPIGVTPLSTTVSRSDESGTYELRMAGHTSVQQTVRLDRDANVHVVLTERAAPRRSRSAPARRRSHERRNAVIDPFE
ncbi:MAG: serine/threonine-protein kinase [Sandaracinaceae bacterium]